MGQTTFTEARVEGSWNAAREALLPRLSMSLATSLISPQKSVYFLFFGSSQLSRITFYTPGTIPKDRESVALVPRTGIKIYKIGPIHIIKLQLEPKT
jgi:hypothetical protein